MINHYSRRQFIKAGSLIAAGSAVFPILTSSTKKPLLSFSTLGCPDWSFDKILSFASANKYDGIEIRGIKRQLDLTKCPEFDNRENTLTTVKKISDNNLKIVDLGSSTELHHPAGAEREKHLDEGRRFIDLSNAIGCPFVRVFPNKLPQGDERKQVIDLIINGLLELGNHAKGSGVTVLIESHGDAVQTNELATIMNAASAAPTGMVWDIVNMWSVTKEPPANVYAILKKYIRHTHIKDLKFINGRERYTFLGTGETPIFDAIDLLIKDNYQGYYSFEWEKLWHPDIEDPELALADYPTKMEAHFQ